MELRCVRASMAFGWHLKFYLILIWTLTLPTHANGSLNLRLSIETSFSTNKWQNYHRLSRNKPNLRMILRATKSSRTKTELRLSRMKSSRPLLKHTMKTTTPTTLTSKTKARSRLCKSLPLFGKQTLNSQIAGKKRSVVKRKSRRCRRQKYLHDAH